MNFIAVIALIILFVLACYTYDLYVRLQGHKECLKSAHEMYLSAQREVRRTEEQLWERSSQASNYWSERNKLQDKVNKLSLELEKKEESYQLLESRYVQLMERLEYEQSENHGAALNEAERRINELEGLLEGAKNEIERLNFIYKK